ncbi:hypothetical protein ABEX47_12925 [Paenibacillus ehimensis]|uniref:hypothetical protein n=1 Tax=Paenibacillus ehimensis TaxID=79264 RepID=UPI003D2D439A
MLVQTVVLGLTLLLAPLTSSLQPGPFSQIVSGEEPGPRDSGTVSPAEAQKVIAKQAEAVIAALKHRDMKQLQRYVHPEKGVRFSPYATVDVNHDLVVKAEQLPALLQDKTVYTWGKPMTAAAPRSN